MVAPTLHLRPLRPESADVWLNTVVQIQAAAMDHPIQIAAAYLPHWREHLTRPGFTAIGAYLPQPGQEHAGEKLAGFTFGFSGRPDQWWNQQLRIGLQQQGLDQQRIDYIANDYFELSEMHILPALQVHGIGRRLMTALLSNRPESRVMASTAEVQGEGSPAWSLLRSTGFVDVLRHFNFENNPKQYAVLGRVLPLTQED